MNCLRTAAAALAVAGLSLPAMALDFTMNFDDIPPAFPSGSPIDPAFGSAVLGYYNNDPIFDRAGKQAWDTTFGADTVAICSFPSAGGDCQGNFATAHSGISAAGAIFGTEVAFAVSPGLQITQLSFWYDVTINSRPSVQLVAGGSSVFAQPLEECTVPGSDGFCGWKQYTVLQSDIAGKLITGVIFEAAPNSAVFDDVFLSTSPIPEPSTYALMLLGLAGVAVAGRRRRR